MNNKQLIVAGMIGLIFMSGCVYCYNYQQLPDGGYAIRKGAERFSEFTVDDKRQYPKELKLAKARFKRRAKFVENWYKKYEPDTLANPIIAFAKEFSLILILPLRAILTPILSPPETEQELAAARKKYSEARKELQDYIVQDCQKEIIPGHAPSGKKPQ